MLCWFAQVVGVGWQLCKLQASSCTMLHPFPAWGVIGGLRPLRSAHSQNAVKSGMFGLLVRQERDRFRLGLMRPSAGLRELIGGTVIGARSDLSLLKDPTHSLTVLADHKHDAQRKMLCDWIRPL